MTLFRGLVLTLFTLLLTTACGGKSDGGGSNGNTRAITPNSCQHDGNSEYRYLNGYCVDLSGRSVDNHHCQNNNTYRYYWSGNNYCIDSHTGQSVSTNHCPSINDNNCRFDQNYFDTFGNYFDNTPDNCSQLNTENIVYYRYTYPNTGARVCVGYQVYNNHSWGIYTPPVNFNLGVGLDFYWGWGFGW